MNKNNKNDTSHNSEINATMAFIQSLVASLNEQYNLYDKTRQTSFNSD
jgi:hypothetical protein